MTLELPLAFAILVPLAGGIGSLLVHERYQKIITALVVFLLLGSTWFLADGIESTFKYEISNWLAPLGINLYVDGLSVVMLLFTIVTSSAIALYATGYFQEEKFFNASRGFWPLFFILWGSLNTIFLVADLFTIYVCLELITFASVAMITIANDKEALKASLTYLMTALMGSVAYLLGVALLYAHTGVLDWTLMSTVINGDPVSWVALSLMTAGLVIKAALFPLHFWLPGAHAIAPAPVSALLSALVVKASFFVMLRLWIQVFPDIHLASHVLGALGAGAIIWGSFQAIIQDRVKLMVAYSTVAQLGYLFLLFPLISAASSLGDDVAKREVWDGAIYFLISHGVAKAAMFLVAGIGLMATKTDYLKDMQGATGRVPAAILVWGLAGISLIGLPPSGGFIAKWLLLTSAIRLGQWPYAAVILFGGLLASGYVFRVLWHAFLAPEDGAPPQTTEKVPYSMVLAALFLGTIIVLMGIRTGEVFALLKIGSPFFPGSIP